MLINIATLDAIKTGDVTLAFRRWRRPTVKRGGTLLTAVGQLAIDDVQPVELQDVDSEQARLAGYANVDELHGALAGRQGQLYRVSLRYLGEDPRIALRESVPDEEEIETIRSRLDRWDRSSPTGPWTRATLQLIADQPATLAADLGEQIGMEKKRFKPLVRRLKELGLTESLKVGYKLSVRGQTVLAALGDED